MAQDDISFVMELATEGDREELMSLYRAQIGREGCPWTEEYPSDETIDYDLSRDALYVMRSRGKIVGAISIEVDEAVNELPCWNKSLEPEVEFARIAVRPEMQGRGLGRKLVEFLLDELKKQGFNGVHIVVNKQNIKALRLYDTFGFRNVGECHLYDQDFYCYELNLR